MQNRKNLFGLIIVLVLGILVSIWAYYYLIIPKDVFYWDESHHALYGMMIADDLQNLNFSQFWHDTGKQALWAPIHSWFLGPWFLLFGISFESARSFSLVPFVASMVMVFLIALRVNRERAWFISAFSVFLMITSSGFLKQSTECMIESLAVFFALLFIYIFLLSPRWSGLLLGVLYLVKYQYAVVFAFGLAAYALWDLIENRKIFWKRFQEYLLVLCGFLVPLLLWHLTPPVEYKFNMLFYGWNTAAWTHGATVSLWDKLSFYPSAILKYYSFSLLAGILLFLSLAFAAFRLKQKEIRLFFFMIVVPLILSAIIKHQEVRYIAIFIPLLYILSGVMILWLVDLWKNRFSQKMGIALLTLIFIVLIPDLLSCPSKAMSYSFNTYAVMKFPGEEGKYNLKDVMTYFYDSVFPNSAVSIGFQAQHLSPYNFMVFFHKRNYILSAFNAQDPNFLKSRYFFSVETNKQNPYWNGFLEADFYKELDRWNAFLAGAKGRGEVVLASSKDFPNLHLKAFVYENAAYGNKSWMR